MPEKPTVLILGAGASMPYGFPSGADLRRLILRELGVTTGAGGITPPLYHLLGMVGFEPSKIKDFTTSLEAADPPSVDVFLEGRRDLKDVGKAAIAATLIPFETDKALFAQWTATQEVQKRMKHRWYDYFANTLQMNFRTWGLQRLTIVTYNYDRSLDHYLWMKMRNSSQQTEEECWKKYKSIPIIHLHGELGVYEPLNPKSLGYGSQVTVNTIRQAAAGIRIIHEVQADERFERAQDALNEAEVVCFLGFGYAAENMARLKWNERNDTSKWKTVFGTVFNLTVAEQQRLKLGQYFNVPQEIPSGWDILDFLRQTNVLG
jgi:hypothetical protein